MKHMSIQQVIDFIQNDDTFLDFAFRGDDFIPVRKFRNSSYHGDDGPERKLSGVSAITIPATGESYVVSAIKAARKYGGNVFLLAGRAKNNYEGDPMEVLMQEHRIVCIVDL